MIKSIEEAKRISEKGRNSPLRGKHGPRKTTLLKEQVIREHYQNNLNVLTELGAEKISIAKIKLHKKFPNSKMAEVKLKAIESVEDRVLGKSVAQNINVNVALPTPIYGGTAN